METKIENFDILVEMNEISKSFSSTKVLDAVNFTLHPGEINCLLGENGAGKSTLIKILSGALTADSGTIKVNGQPVKFSDPNDARECGIIPIYQELDLIDCMSVTENIFLNQEVNKNFLSLDHKQMQTRTKKMLLDLGIDIDVNAKLEEYSVAIRQMIAVAKAISVESKILILDEPSDVLTGNELKVLFEIIKKVKEKGVGIIYISHRLEEIFEIGDVVTILRDGKLITRMPVRELTRPQLIRHMVGREINEDIVEKNGQAEQPVALTVDNISNKSLHGVSFALREGEILGIFGLVGAGRTELAKAIFGMDKIESGSIVVGENKMPIKRPSDAIKQGIGLIPEDRKNEGLIQILSVKYNMILPSISKLCRAGFLAKQKIRPLIQEYVDAFRIKISSVEQQVKTLSGGNQQKVVLAKWLATGSKILILDEPTRGVDVNAKSEIYKIIEQFSTKNHAIILISSEMREILSLSNRIMVMSEGYVTKCFDNNRVTQEELLEYAMPKSLLVKENVS